ncbi:MAG: FHA domain-containing protein [Planctomycetota bacterium]|nr:FHA domain-containing protein [Planctomycetota bacterium]
MAIDSNSASACAAPSSAYIRVLGGELTGGVFRLDGKPIVIGSSADVHLRLPDTLAHGRHAGLRFHAGCWHIHDLTGEGLSVNDIATTSRALSGGEILRVGATELQFSLDQPKRGFVEASVTAVPKAQDVVLELRVELGDQRDQGLLIPLYSGQELLIGRAAEAHLSLHDCRASRLHCRIEDDCGAVAIIDLSSLNGTHVDGSQVQRAVLRAGDTILIGRTSIRCLKP